MSGIRYSGKFNTAPIRRRRRMQSTYSATAVHQAVMTLTSLSEQVATVVEDVEKFLICDLRELLDIRPLESNGPEEGDAIGTDEVLEGTAITDDTCADEPSELEPAEIKRTLNGKNDTPRRPRRRLFVLRDTLEESDVGS